MLLRPALLLLSCWLGLFVSRPALANCIEACQTEFATCKEVAGAGCATLGGLAERGASQLLGGLPGGSLLSGAAGKMTAKACEEKIAPCNAALAACQELCSQNVGSGVGQQVISGAAVMPIAAAPAAMNIPVPLAVYSSVPRAVVYVDGRRAGRTPSDKEDSLNTTPLLPGQYAIRVESGSRFWEGTVEIVAGAINSVEAKTLKTEAGWVLYQAEALERNRQASAAVMVLREVESIASASSQEKKAAREGIARLAPGLEVARAQQLFGAGLDFPTLKVALKRCGPPSRRPKASRPCRRVFVRRGSPGGSKAKRRLLPSRVHSPKQARDGEQPRRLGRGVPGHPQEETVMAALASISAERKELVAPLNKKIRKSMKAGPGAQGRAAREAAGKAVAKQYKTLEDKGLAPFLEATIAETGFWASPEERDSVAAISDFHWEDRPRGRALLLGGGFVTAVMPSFFAFEPGSKPNGLLFLIPNAGFSSFAAVQSIRHENHLRRRYGAAYPKNQRWGDTAVPHYLMAGTAFAGFGISVLGTQEVAASVPPDRLDSDAVPVAMLANTQLAMGVVNLAIAGFYTYARTRPANPVTKNLRVHASPFGLFGTF